MRRAASSDHHKAVMEDHLNKAVTVDLNKVAMAVLPNKEVMAVLLSRVVTVVLPSKVDMVSNNKVAIPASNKEAMVSKEVMDNSKADMGNHRKVGPVATLPSSKAGMVLLHHQGIEHARFRMICHGSIGSEGSKGFRT